jgi:DNA-binding response OmpR family regulator
MTDEKSHPVVLVAEDDEGVRSTLEVVLGIEGFDVLLAGDGRAALDLAREIGPDVILLDRIMPRMDGRELLGALRAEPATRDIPVLVLSGMPPEPNEWPGAEFVGKPFDVDELVKRVRAALDAQV